MHFNWIVILGGAVVPFAIGFAWYKNSLFGPILNNEKGLATEKSLSMVWSLFLSLFFGFLISAALIYIVIHQAHLFSIVLGDPQLKDPNSDLSLTLKNFMDSYGRNFRTFKHGALHGTIAAITIALPVIGINALFEKKNLKYIILNASFWVLTFALIGGFICAFA